MVVNMLVYEVFALQTSEQRSLCPIPLSQELIFSKEKHIKKMFWDLIRYMAFIDVICIF